MSGDSSYNILYMHEEWQSFHHSVKLFERTMFLSDHKQTVTSTSLWTLSCANMIGIGVVDNERVHVYRDITRLPHNREHCLVFTVTKACSNNTNLFSVAFNGDKKWLPLYHTHPNTHLNEIKLEQLTVFDRLLLLTAADAGLNDLDNVDLNNLLPK